MPNNSVHLLALGQTLNKNNLRTVSYTHLAACGAAPSSSAAAGTSQAASSAAGAAMPADMPWSHVEPLAEPVTLNVALLANTLPHLPTYIAQEKGWLGAVGIEVSPVVFKNGPSMTEAMGAGAWDCGSTGIGRCV